MGARVRGQASDTRLWEPAENSSTLNIALTFSFPIAKDRERCVRIDSTISATESGCTSCSTKSSMLVS